MKRKLVAMTLAAVMGLSVAACGSGGDDKTADDGKNTEDNADGGAADDGAADDGNADAADDGAADGGDAGAASGDVANKDKPLVWFNRQPSNSSTGELDMSALTFRNCE